MSKINLIISQLQRTALYLFFFSINFEVWEPFSTGGYFSISKFTGLVYLVTITPQIGNFIRTDRISSFLRPILFFFGLLTLVSLVNINSYTQTFFDLSIFLNIFLFLLLINHARKEPLVLEMGMLWFSFGSVSLALLYNAGIGVEYLGGRVSLFGDNQNIIGLRMCISMTILILAVLQNKLRFGSFRYLFFLPIPLMLHLMFQTGSRVATISFCLIFIVGVILLKTNNIWSKISFSILGIIAFGYGWNFMLQSETLVLRLLNVSDVTGLAGRDLIWEKLFPLIENNPILGVGKTGYALFARNVFGVVESPHNVILEILCYTGFVGLLIYLIFLARLFKAGFQSYTMKGELLPLLLIIPVVGILLSGQILNVKIGWVIFSYIVGSSLFRSDVALR